eukprot:TRINITY_DN4437_c0_g1_i2.p1 TRINITY_DN4437_c0_g1~~TRINITY_DN4437_c0_g1_i2.p1  ORF type:complete len:190 (+),score=53.91 TRINITY_DN4437_c0_g1_i2:121-690(+)
MESRTKTHTERQNDKLKECIRTMHETNDLANHTAKELHDQNNKIDKMIKDTRDTQSELDKSKWLLNGMSSFWGYVSNSVLPFKEKKPPTDPNPTKAPTNSTPTNSNVREDPKLQKSTTAPIGSIQTNKTEENLLLEELLGQVRGLKATSLETGKAIDESNQKLKILTTEVDKTEKKLHEVNAKSKKLLS